MGKEIRRHYTLLVDFLGHILGPDYEVALHELTEDSNQIIAISNGELTGRHLGSPLSNKMLEFLSGRLYETQDYVLSFESTSVTGKKMHSNSMFIKDRTGSVPSGTSLIVDQNDPSESAREQGFPTSIAGATASIVSSVVANYPVDVDRLNQDEKMEIMEILDRKGVFLLKGSVSFVAKELHSSEASIYRYLGKLNSRSGK